ncbi:MAG: septum formation protein Maf [Calditrichaeota bacterium]|nr:MAG: septum formation protein Maf [Calditrichota bacterium]
MDFLQTLCKLEGKKIILASQSPRRIELLRKIGLKFTTYTVDGEEKLSSYLSPTDFARQIAAQKAEEAIRKVKGDLIITADTIVVKGEHIFGKPENDEDARQMLLALSDDVHEVITAFCLITPRQTIIEHESTRVTFYPLTDEEIDAYIASGEPFDKAGAYAIQGYAGVFVKAIEGCYFNVMGFPLGKFYQRLKDVQW